MTVRAPQDGIVVYQTNWRDEKKKVGDSVWFGEKILALPDLAG
jgi:HlyD family secretion protein